MAIEKGEASKIQIVSWSEVGKHISSLADSLDALLATIQQRFERNDHSLVLFNLGRRALQEARRVAIRIEEPIEETAWSVRNLHEIDLSIRYIQQDEDHLKDWLGQMSQDEKDIIEGVLVLQNKMKSEDVQSSKARLQRVEEGTSRFGFKMRKPWRMSDIARKTDRETEYKMLYKFYSKFVHPSSWLANGRIERVQSTTTRTFWWV
jgi:Family of unknown function (DUF5677)